LPFADWQFLIDVQVLSIADWQFLIDVRVLAMRIAKLPIGNRQLTIGNRQHLDVD
jgi:hypothetical protein